MDLSVAPELAQFAQRSPLTHPLPPAAPRTLGEHADTLIRLAASPQLWWDQVLFDPGEPVRVPLEPGTWLLVVTPLSVAACECRLATLIAGEAAEDGTWLRPGRARVYGRDRPHVLRATAAGYAVSLHLRPEG